MSKKIAALVGAGAMLFAAAVPALATCYGSLCWFGGSDNEAYVYNNASANVNTGGNSQGNSVLVSRASVGGMIGSGSVNVSGNNSMTTGDATARARAGVVANTHGCLTCGYSSNYANVTNLASVGADTGKNVYNGNAVQVEDASVGGLCGSGSVKVGGNNSMTTGDASVKSRAWVMVNIHR